MGRLMIDTVDTYWKVREYTDEAKGIAFDTCHKIYVLMDEEQVALMRSYGYGADDPNAIATSEQLDPAEMATVVMTWYEKSCSLKFINAVYSDKSIGHEGFVDIVTQFENMDDEDEDDEDV
jgi:hypothetical protein